MHNGIMGTESKELESCNVLINSGKFLTEKTCVPKISISTSNFLKIMYSQPRLMYFWEKTIFRQKANF